MILTPMIQSYMSILCSNHNSTNTKEKLWHLLVAYSYILPVLKTILCGVCVCMVTMMLREGRISWVIDLLPCWIWEYNLIVLSPHPCI